MSSPGTPRPVIHPVDERLPALRLATLGLQHALVMYAGAVAVPLIVGRALRLDPAQMAMLIAATLFTCGLVTLIQSLGVSHWLGVRLPVMMGVTFAAIGPMVSFAGQIPGPEGARAILGAVIGAGAISILIAPLVGRLVRYFPPVVTGSIIAIIGITLMRVGVGWAVGGPAPSAQGIDVPRLIAMVDAAREAATAGDPSSAAAGARSSGSAMPVILSGPVPLVNNPAYGALDNLAIAGIVLLIILALVRFSRGFLANISVLLGIVLGCLLAASVGKMTLDKVASAPWFDVVVPFAFGRPTFHPVMVLTMTVVMIVVMVESTGMFLALSEITGKPVGQREVAAGLRANAVGTVLSGVLNSFPVTSFSQNVGLVGMTGVYSRWVCVAGGLILMVLGLLPKMAALGDSVPVFVLGGAGLVMFGMVVATGIRILSTVDFRNNRNNLYIVALSIGFGLVPLIAPRWSQQMPQALAPMLDSGILLTAVVAIVLNLFFNGGVGRSGETAATGAPVTAGMSGR